MSLLPTALEQLRDQFATLAKQGCIDARLLEESIYSPREVDSEDWQPLSQFQKLEALSPWPHRIGAAIYRQPVEIAELAEHLKIHL